MLAKERGIRPCGDGHSKLEQQRESARVKRECNQARHHTTTQTVNCEIRETLTALQQEMTTKMQEQMMQAAEKNKKDGEAFLAENKKKEGVVTTASGLQYKILKKGDGRIPKPDELVTAHYKGTLIDGTEFDSSFKRNKPAQCPVGGVIKGWQEALPLMPVGSKWQLFIPSELAYGERGAGRGSIGPNATLIFDVELISIDEK